MKTGNQLDLNPVKEMNILLMNAGSSSVKWKLFEEQSEELIAKGSIERMMNPGSSFEIKFKDQVYEETIDNLSYEKAAEMIIEKIQEMKITSLDKIKAVGHRVVAGGEKFTKATKIDESNFEDLEEMKDFAPLHNPMETRYIKLMQDVMPNTPQYAVFDSKFFLDIPEFNAIYSLPYEYTKKYQIRRYGEHGISHTYLTKRTAELLNMDQNKINMIALHLGGGASIAAIKNGKAYDTSMGFAPLTGLTMGTRAGDVDPSLVPFLMNKLEMSAEEVLMMLNQKSGLLGVSELSSDMRDLAAKQDQDPQVKLAIDIFVNRVVKYVAGYFVELGHVDAVVFAGGIGENNPWLRQRIIDELSVLGLKMDVVVDNENQEGITSKEDSSAKILLVPTNEELEMIHQIKAEL